jgi:hypothetical protein
LTHGTDFAVYDPEDAIFTQIHIPTYSLIRHEPQEEEPSREEEEEEAAAE